MTTEEVLYLLDESLRKIIVKEEVIEKNNTGWVVYPPNTEADFPGLSLFVFRGEESRFRVRESRLRLTQ